MGAHESVVRVEDRQAADPDGKWSIGPLTPNADSLSKQSSMGFGMDGEILVEAKHQDVVAARVFVHSLASGIFRDEFVVQLDNVADVQFWQGIRSRYHFERLHEELGCEHGGTTIQPLPGRKAEYFKMQPVVWTLYMHDSGSLLQAWLNQVIRAGFGRSGSFKRFLSHQAVPQPVSIRGWDTLSHMILALPMMDDVVSFLEEPLDVINLCELTSKTISQNGKLLCAHQWERMYAERWPAFYESQCHMSKVTHMETDWKSMCLGSMADFEFSNRH